MLFTGCAAAAAAAAAAKSLQSCLTLCDPIDGSPPGSAVPGILQARTLEWVAISFSNACMHAKSFSCLRLRGFEKLMMGFCFYLCLDFSVFNRGCGTWALPFNPLNY